MLSSASPALHARLLLLERFMPLPLVEAGHVAAALAGLLLLVLARGLAAGIARRSATLSCCCSPQVARSSKGWTGKKPSCSAGSRSRPGRRRRCSTATVAATGSRVRTSPLRSAPSRLFLAFGSLSHRVSASDAGALVGRSAIACRRARFMRTAASMLWRARRAASLYVLMRPPVRFEPPDERDDRPRARLHARIGSGTNPLMVAIGDKAVFVDGDARILSLSHHRSVPRGVFGSGRAVARRARRVPRRALRLRGRARSPAGVLSDVARLDPAAARPRLRLLQARRGGAGATRARHARRACRQDEAADPAASANATASRFGSSRRRDRDSVLDELRGDLGRLAAGEGGRRAAVLDRRTSIDDYIRALSVRGRRGMHGSRAASWRLPICSRVRGARSCRST